MNIPNMVNSVEEIDNAGLREFAEGLIAEATTLGLTFKAYGYLQLMEQEAPMGGVHVFHYEWTNEVLPNGERFQSLNSFLTGDDDSQPHSTFAWYFGDVWHFVPFYC